MIAKSKDYKINWIRDKISRIAYGEKTIHGIRPNISKKFLIKNNKLLVRRLPNYKIIDHVNNNNTIYYYGNGKTNGEETLVMIDIDVQKKQKKGSPKGAEDFANHLKKYFPKLYYEKSTNNEGVHAYFILKKYGISANRVNKTLKSFENWLKKESEKISADIENVEIKGLCPEIIYINNKISNIKYGTLAKIPRNLDELSFNDNQYLNIKDIEKEYSYYKKNIKQEGSTSDKLFTDSDLKNIIKYKKIFNILTNNHKLRARKHIVTDEDFAIALLILMFIHKNPNKDESLPTERAKQLWISLFKYHNVKRNWNHHRWKLIRDFLSMNNFINWIDNKYSFGNKIKNKKGISCKWKLSEKFVLYVQNVLCSQYSSEKKTSLMDTIRTININIKERTLFLVPKLKILSKDYYENMIMKIYCCMNTLCSV